MMNDADIRFETESEKEQRYEDLMQAIADLLGEKGYELDSHEETAVMLAEVSAGYRPMTTADPRDLIAEARHLEALGESLGGELSGVWLFARNVRLALEAVREPHNSGKTLDRDEWHAVYGDGPITGCKDACCKGRKPS